MYHFEKIKLVIWDLDDTFWNGTLSEGDVTIPESHKKAIKMLTDVGVINSICSKNEWVSVKQILDENDLTDYFVFNSVNWEPKGSRIKQMIGDMRLRPENVLFLDDNPINLGEAEYYCPGIMAEAPSAIPQLIRDITNVPLSDPEHNRLKQYKLLEEKREAQVQSISNEDFLRGSCIQVSIHHDCLAQLSRISDLILRTNQLNFTKNRCSETDLRLLLENPDVSSGYIMVSDRFGDYGIVGFYAIHNQTLVHFLFSCRTLGMGVEQYIYNYLHRPQLSVIGEVVSDLTEQSLPSWINQKSEGGNVRTSKLQITNEQRILIKGPCDLYQIFPYISNRGQFDTEFTHISDRGIPVETTSHTTHVVEALRLTAQQKCKVISEVPFADEDIYNDALYCKDYKVVVLSVLQDANMGVYERKETGEKIAFLEYNHPLTDPSSWDGLISGKYYNAGFSFNKEMLREFADKYKFLGRNTPDTVVENLSYIRKHLPQDCLLIVMLGGELYYEKNTIEAYEDRHVVHQKMNQNIRVWAEKTKGIRLLDVNKYLVDQSSFYDHFNHYIKPVYYAMSTELVGMINDHIDLKIYNTSRFKVLLMEMKDMLAPMYNLIKRTMKFGRRSRE